MEDNQAENVFVQPVQELAELVSENVHAIENVHSEKNMNITTFRLNTHTYDTVDMFQIPDNQEILDFENLHAAASEQVKTKKVVSAVKPRNNVRSGPEENFFIILSFGLSSIVWFGMKKVRV